MADQMPQVPQIADISVQQAPQQNLALDDALSRVSEQAQAKLPSPYTQGYTQTAPKLPTVREFTPQDDNKRPIGGGSAMLKAQDTRNSIASLSNMIGKAGQAIAQKKQDNLKADLTTVMQAKTNAENAMAVLKQDPNNKMAQGVLAANKKRLNDILSDPKKQKQLAKALDLSYTDPESNKTPEIAAGQQAIAAVKQAGPYNANNPAEAKIAQQAQQGVKPQQQSATPQADQALAKDLPTIEQNPQYAPAVAQQQAAQKALWTNIIPKAIQAQVDMQKTQLQQGSANARANLNAQVAYYKEQQGAIDKMAQISAEAKSRLQLENVRAAHQMADTKMRVDAMKQIATTKLQDPTQKIKMQTEAMGTIDKSITGKIQSSASLKAQMAVAGVTDDQKKTLQAQIDMNDKDIAQTQQYRQQMAKDWYGITGSAPAPPPQDGNQPQGEGWFKQFTKSKAANVLGGSAGTVGTGVANAAGGSAGTSATTEQSRPNIQVIGRDASDESSSDSGDTDSQDDSDIFGNDSGS
jgi:hypothetical protein